MSSTGVAVLRDLVTAARAWLNFAVRAQLNTLVSGALYGHNVLTKTAFLISGGDRLACGHRRGGECSSRVPHILIPVYICARVERGAARVDWATRRPSSPQVTPSSTWGVTAGDGPISG